MNLTFNQVTHLLSQADCVTAIVNEKLVLSTFIGFKDEDEEDSSYIIGFETQDFEINYPENEDNIVCILKGNELRFLDQHISVFLYQNMKFLKL